MGERGTWSLERGAVRGAVALRALSPGLGLRWCPGSPLRTCCHRSVQGSVSSQVTADPWKVSTHQACDGLLQAWVLCYPHPGHVDTKNMGVSHRPDNSWWRGSSEWLLAECGFWEA